MQFTMLYWGCSPFGFRDVQIVFSGEKEKKGVGMRELRVSKTFLTFLAKILQIVAAPLDSRKLLMKK